MLLDYFAETESQQKMEFWPCTTSKKTTKAKWQNCDFAQMLLTLVDERQDLVKTSLPW